MSAIRLDRVVKSWGSARAVDGISLEADAGSLQRAGEEHLFDDAVCEVT